VRKKENRALESIFPPSAGSEKTPAGAPEAAAVCRKSGPEFH
jgi:hypothetical protein